MGALRRINPGPPEDTQQEAVRRVERVGQPSLILTNRAFHAMLANGLEVDIMTPEGLRGERVVLVDFNRPDADEFLAVNQVTVVGTHKRRPDIVVFVDGLPLAMIELKNMASETATIDQAFNQLQTYKEQIPRLFHTNELLVISDGALAQIGTITSGRERFATWKTNDGEVLEMAQIIDATIELAQTMRGDVNRGEQLGLSRDEYAFYKAIALSPSAQAVMSDDDLLTIAQAVRNNATID